MDYRLAFFMYMGLPHGRILLENNAELFNEFLLSCRRTKSCCALCNQWRQQYGKEYADSGFSNILNREDDEVVKKNLGSMITLSRTGPSWMNCTPHL
jgi:hypothetical protein